MAKVLVVGGELSTLEMVCEMLMTQGYDVCKAVDGIEGYHMYLTYKPDIVITDFAMENMDGKQLTRLIRKENKEIPVVMLSTKVQEADEIAGFESGANDFIHKPFSAAIFLSRVKAQLKNVRKKEKEELSLLEYEDIKLDLNQFVAIKSGNEVNLTLKEFKILEYLMKNANQVLTRDEIIEQIWGKQYYGDTRIIDTHIKNIRRKLVIKNIKTIKGVGYNFNVR